MKVLTLNVATKVTCNPCYEPIRADHEELKVAPYVSGSFISNQPIYKHRMESSIVNTKTSKLLNLNNHVKYLCCIVFLPGILAKLWSKINHFFLLIDYLGL